MFDYETISRGFLGWTLTEIKKMGVRERRYWVESVRRRPKGAR